MSAPDVSDEIAALLRNPEAVRLNMLRGSIAVPSDISWTRDVVAFLHHRANEMNDPSAKAALNAVAHEVGLNFHKANPDFPSGNGETETG